MQKIHQSNHRSPTVLHIITSLGDGGAEAVLFRLCAHSGLDRQHVVSLTGGGKYGPLLAVQGVSVTTLDMPRGRISLRGAWRLFRLICRIRPDVVQTWMYHADLLGGFLAFLAGCRNIVWGIHNTTLVPGASRRSTILVARICARLSRIVPRRIICCAENAREVHATQGYDRARMEVVANGYDLAEFRPDPEARRQLRAELGIASDTAVIGFVARYDPMKDHATLLCALSVLQARGQCPLCLLVGTEMDHTNAALVAKIAALDLGEQVRLLGRRSDIPVVMNALDLNVMSSIAEAFPNVLAEAMACATPCVSTDVGDAATILGATGRVVPTRDPEALADAIADLLTERDGPDWANRCASARQRVADHFSIERMVTNYRRIWFGTDATAWCAEPEQGKIL